MKNTTRLRLEHTTSISFHDARRAAHLRCEGWSHAQKLAGLETCAVELLPCVQTNTCSLLQGCGFEPHLQPNIFLFQGLIWEVANGAKAGLKLRLVILFKLAR